MIPLIEEHTDDYFVDSLDPNTLEVTIPLFHARDPIYIDIGVDLDSCGYHIKCDNQMYTVTDFIKEHIPHKDEWYIRATLRA